MSKMTINKYGNQIWLNKAEQCHRLDGPAFIHADGHQVWLVDGLRHRLDGPAVIWTGGTQAWWINGVHITDKVKFWIKENNFPDYSLWTDGQKIMFRLAFSGISS